jgi:hypothetical protein
MWADLLGRLPQTVSWGLGAILSITANDLLEEDYKQLSNLPPRAFYGVSTDSAVGVPRTATAPMADHLSNEIRQPLTQLRETIKNMPTNIWRKILGDSGTIYQKVWCIMEGLE